MIFRFLFLAGNLLLQVDTARDDRRDSWRTILVQEGRQVGDRFQLSHRRRPLRGSGAALGLVK